MTEKPEGEHVATEELADYFAGSLSQERELAVELHLAACNECTQQARQVYSFTALFERWTSKQPAEPALPIVLARCLEAARDRMTNQLWRERLNGWRERWGGKAEGAVRVILGAPGKATRILTDGLDNLLRPAATLRFVPEALVGVNSVRGKLDQGSVALASAPGVPRVRISASGLVGEVEIRIDDLPQTQTPPLILLIPAVGGIEVRVAELSQTPGVPYWIGRFEQIDPGDYFIVLEPMH